MRSCWVRVLLVVFFMGTLLLGGLNPFSSSSPHEGGHDDSWQENRPVSQVLRLLNMLLKRAGCFLSLSVWAIMLGTRYYRQACMQENTRWRSQAIVDGILWIGAFLYWLLCVWLFALVAFNVGECRSAGMDATDAGHCERLNGHWIPFDISGHAFLCSFAIALLVEEAIRAYDGPFCRRLTSRRQSPLWWLSISLATLLILTWSILYVRTALFFHTLLEKILGTAIGLFYWLLVLSIRTLISPPCSLALLRQHCLSCLCLCRTNNTVPQSKVHSRSP